MNKKIYAVLVVLSTAIATFLMIYLGVYSGDILTFIFNLVFFLLINLVLVILVHELGHLVFGKISGYKFVSFRFLFFLIYRNEDNKIAFTTQSFLPSLVGQCFMEYPYETENAPYKLYNYGGLIFSYSYSFIMLIASVLGNYNSVSNLFLVIGFLVSIIINLSNSVVEDGIINDLCNINEISKNEVTKKCFFYQLEVLGSLSRGCFFNDVKEEIDFNLIDVKVTLQIASLFFAYYAKMEILKYEEGKEILNKLYDNIYNIHSIYKDSITYTYLFHTIVFENDFEKAREIIKRHKLENELENAYKVKAEMNLRLFLAYKIYIKEDYKDIEKYIIKAKKVINKSPFIREKYLLDSWVNTMNTYYIKKIEELEFIKKEEI